MSKLPIRASLLAIAGFICTSGAAAQDSNSGSEEPPPGPIEQAGSLPGERLQVEAGAEDGLASVSLSLLARGGRTEPDDRHVYSYHTDRLNLILSTPWNGEDDALPASLDGLANGTKLTLRWGRHVGFLRADRTDAMRTVEAAAREACRARVQGRYTEQLQAAESALTDPADPNSLQRRRQVLAEERERSLDACAFPPGGWGNLIDDHLPARAIDYVRMLRPRGSFEFGIEGSIGRNGFEFVNPSTLEQLKATKTQWSGRAYFSYYPVGWRTAFTITAGYERAYEAADEAVLCPANPANVTIRCTTAAAGPPELNESLLFSVGLRHRFAGGILSNVAVAPVFTYDALDEVVGVDFPIYFVPNSDGGLSGGVRVGYRSDRESEFSAGIFIGAAFNILGGG